MQRFTFSDDDNYLLINTPFPFLLGHMCLNFTVCYEIYKALNFSSLKNRFFWVLCVKPKQLKLFHSANRQLKKMKHYNQ